MQQQQRKWLRPLVAIFGVILVLIAAGLFSVTSRAYQPSLRAQTALSDVREIIVDDKDGLITFTNRNVQPAKGGIIFYQGGLVATASYARIARTLAESGYFVVLPHMPLNLAILNSGVANNVMSQYPDINKWIIGGHSLGGVMAARFVAGSTNDEIKGLFLLGAYPEAGIDLTHKNIKVVSIIGDQDKLVNKQTWEDNKKFLPANTNFLTITGGNHAQFGDYGVQSGDGEATIAIEEQQSKAIEAILEVGE